MTLWAGTHQGKWGNKVTSTHLISLIGANSFRCTSLPNLVVIGLIEMEISILILILTWIPLEKAELTALVHHMKRFSKPMIPIYNSEVPETACSENNSGNKKKTRAFVKCYAFHPNSIRRFWWCRRLRSKSTKNNPKSQIARPHN